MPSSHMCSDSGVRTLEKGNRGWDNILSGLRIFRRVCNEPLGTPS